MNIACSTFRQLGVYLIYLVTLRLFLFYISQTAEIDNVANVPEALVFMEGTEEQTTASPHPATRLSFKFYKT